MGYSSLHKRPLVAQRDVLRQLQAYTYVAIEQKLIFLDKKRCAAHNFLIDMTNYEKENWVELYRAALLELEHAKMHGRIAHARESIVARVAKLHDLPGLHEEERQAIQDALNNLRVLEHEDAQYTMEEKRHALEKAHRSLQIIVPKILRLE